MKHPFVMTGLCALLLAVLPIAAAQEAPIALPDLAGRRVNPFADRRAKAIVFVFVRTDCPISNRYAPELKRLQRRFAARFFFVYPSAGATVEKHAAEYGFAPTTVLLDARRELVKLTGVRVTPEVAVFAHAATGHRLVYRGRIDDRVVAFGQVRPRATQHDLANVLRALAKNAEVKFKEQPAIGCYIANTDADTEKR